MWPAASCAVTVMTLVPRFSGIGPLFQFGVPVAVPLSPRPLVHVTSETPTSSLLVPVKTMDVDATLYVDADVGPLIVTVGAVVSAGGVEDIVTVNTSFARLPAASRAWTVMTLVPPASGTEGTLQPAVPLATPLPPRSLTQDTCDTPLLSEAVPLNGIDADEVLYVAVLVGPVIVTLGGVLSDTGAVAIVHVNG
jgi:hypothetical protein